MPEKRYFVDLTQEEEEQQHQIIRRGRASARKIARVHILLLAHEGESDTNIAKVLHLGRCTVERTRKRFVEGGIDWALNERSRPGGCRKLDGKQEAFLVALACSNPPEGRTCWTMQLLAEKLVELGVVEAISDETVRRVFKKTKQSLG